MGFKAWLARHTSSPRAFAASYSSGIVELSEHVARSLVAFAGHKKAFSSKPEAQVFESHFDMLESGYESFTMDVVDLVGGFDPGVAPELYSRALVIVSTFSLLHSQSSAYRYMREDHAHSFSVALVPVLLDQLTSGVRRSRPDLEKKIRELIPRLSCNKLLNKESFGLGDCLGKILAELSVSDDHSTSYAFVVGSVEQSLGCATAYLELVQTIDENIRRGAEEIGW